MAATPDDRIDAQPTKRFFVEMFTKDIALEQAVLDLVDNSIDGARRAQKEGSEPLADYWVKIVMTRSEFRIDDNCGGFDKATARTRAFKFGREIGAVRTPGSIGQFGVGMKRALFKFGKRFKVYSATTEEKWGIDVTVADWESEPEWRFDWSTFEPASDLSESRPGTEVFVGPLHPSVSQTFGTKSFENLIIDLIKSKHRRFISEGLNVTVNGTRVQPIELRLYSGGQFSPASTVKTFDGETADELPVHVRIIAGVGESSPKQGGWYVICNGRVVLEGDTRSVTGWGDVADEISLPRYHGQFARFRGIATFDSDSAERVPWNTTKTDIDTDNPVWRSAREKMMELMRPVIDFLNVLDADIEQHTRERSPMLKELTQTSMVKYETIAMKAEFAVPSIEQLDEVVPYTKIQYSRPVDDVEVLKKALGLGSAKAVGERTFDSALQRQRGR